MVKIRLNESQLINLFEAVSLSDIYSKYYSKIDSDIFRKIVESDPTWRVEKPDKMGKFGKWLLQLWVNKRLKLEDLYKAKEYLTYFIKYNNRIEVRDINKYKSLVDLYNVVKVYMDNPDMSVSHSDDIRKIKDGAEKVYENKEWLIIVPHTEEASCYYGKGTQWCTAAEKSHNMFNHYNDQGNLYININKLSGDKYQFHFESNSFMDATDCPIDSPIYETIGLDGGVLDYYKSSLSSENFNKIVETKIEVNANDDGEILMYCTTPYIDYWYLYDESYGDLIADRLKKVDPYYITNSLHLKGFVIIENIYGFYTLVTLSDNGCHKKIGDNYISVDNVDNVFGSSFSSYSDYPGEYFLCTVNSDGLMEIQGEYGYYSIDSSMIDGRGCLINDVLWVRKKNGLYDLIDINYERCLYNLRPVDVNEPLKTDDSGEILYMYNGNDELWRIELLSGLDYYEIDNIEDEY